MTGTLQVPEVLGNNTLPAQLTKTHGARTGGSPSTGGRTPGGWGWGKDLRLIPWDTAQYISPRFTGRSPRRKCIVPDEAGISGSQD